MAKAQVATATKNVPAVQQGGQVSLFSEERPDWLTQGEGRGSENVSSQDLIIPRLEIVQATSPIKDEDEDAKDGYIYNSVTKEMYGNRVHVLPIFFRKEFLVWAIREKGKPAPADGFKGAYQSAPEAQDAIDGFEHPEKYEVVDTPQQFCLLIRDDGKVEEVVLSMSRTKNKVSRKWNSLIRMAGGDRFSKVYALHGVKEENAFGKFHNFDVEPVGFPTKQLYERAEKLYEGIVGGSVKVTADAEPAERSGVARNSDDY
jgi:hypothetical protein